jgi:hypothetical protein
MSLLLLLQMTEAGEAPRMGDGVHLSVTSRPEGDRCTAAVVTRVKDERLYLTEFTAYSGKKPVYGGSGFRHTSSGDMASWHRRSECPDGL